MVTMRPIACPECGCEGFRERFVTGRNVTGCACVHCGRVLSEGDMLRAGHGRLLAPFAQALDWIVGKYHRR